MQYIKDWVRHILLTLHLGFRQRKKREESRKYLEELLRDNLRAGPKTLIAYHPHRLTDADRELLILFFRCTSQIDREILFDRFFSSE